MLSLQVTMASGGFATDISRSVVVHEAQKVGKTLFETHPTHKLCNQYRKVAAEIEARVAGVILQNANDPAELNDDADLDEEAIANG